MLSFQTILFALLGGVLPALLWLWFWLKEDKKRPEPRGLILLAFIAGMLTVPVVLPFEKLADSAKPLYRPFALSSGRAVKAGSFVEST